VKQQPLLGVLVLTFGNLLHLSRRGLTSFECRFLKEFEESLLVPGKTAFSSFEAFLQSNKSVSMEVSPHLHGSIPHVEKLADFLVLRLPIFLLTSLGTIQGGLAYSAVLEPEIRRFSGDSPALQVMQLKLLDMIGVGVECGGGSVMENRSRGEQRILRVFVSKTRTVVNSKIPVMGYGSISNAIPRSRSDSSWNLLRVRNGNLTAGAHENSEKSGTQ
jgi:hypothetical protein